MPMRFDLNHGWITGAIIMTSFVALLRAVNVGGTGKLPMKDLKALCERVGLAEVRTYIASGNVVFESDQSEQRLKQLLEAELEKYAGKPVGVLIRTAAEMEEILANNPFPRAVPNRVVAVFLQEAPAGDALDRVTGCDNEEIELGKREIYVHYRNGIGKSKLEIPATAVGTARNMNTLTRLTAMAKGS